MLGEDGQRSQVTLLPLVPQFVFAVLAGTGHIVSHLPVTFEYASESSGEHAGDAARVADAREKKRQSLLPLRRVEIRVLAAELLRRGLAQ